MWPGERRHRVLTRDTTVVRQSSAERGCVAGQARHQTTGAARPNFRRHSPLSTLRHSRSARLMLEGDVAAEMNFQAEFGEHRGFNPAGAMSLLFIRRVNDLDVV